MQAVSSQTPFRILLIDSDEVHARLIFGWFTERADMQLTQCASIDEVQRKLPLTQWDLVVVNLEDLAARQTPTTTPLAGSSGVPVLAIARQFSPELMKVALHQRVSGVLGRPYSRKEFFDQVMSLAQAKRKQRAKQKQVILAIGAHPDDVEIGCGGTLLKKRALGHDVVLLTLSRGGKGGDVDQRMKEAWNASRLLGAKLKVCDLPDSGITDGSKTIELIEQAVREVAPTNVYTHSRHDTHQDHRNVHLATMVATRQTPNVYCYQSPSTTIDFRPNLFVDISEQMATKVQMIEAYRSQVARHAGLEGDFIEATARYWGRHANYALVEPLEVIRQLED